MHDYTPPVTNSLANAAHRDGIGKEESLIFRPDEYLGQSKERKYRDEEGSQAEIWSIPVNGILHRTVWEGHLGTILGDSMLHFEN